MKVWFPNSGEKRSSFEHVIPETPMLHEIGDMVHVVNPVLVTIERCPHCHEKWESVTFKRYDTYGDKTFLTRIVVEPVYRYYEDVTRYPTWKELCGKTVRVVGITINKFGFVYYKVDIPSIRSRQFTVHCSHIDYKLEDWWLFLTA